jgi:putative tryptophan/tyrosine transport system substrate-binding protein
MIGRREFIALLGGAAAAWPVAARAQQGERVRRIGVLMGLSGTDPESSRRLMAFRQGLRELGWTEGRNVRIDARWATGDADRFRQYAAELIALDPDVILAIGSTTLGPLQRTTRTVPIVFALVADPVGGGFVEGLARPGGNATGFTLFEYSISGKWLQLLKEIAPRMTRAAFLRDHASPSGIGQFAALQSAASSIGVEVSPANVRDADEIERSIATFARASNGGLIVTTTSVAIVHRELILELAARHKLPAIFWDRFYVSGGGLISYGADTIDQCRRAADYVDRILKGERPADLPVQAATKYQLVINLKTARMLGLEVPPTLLARADEVIE